MRPSGLQRTIAVVGYLLPLGGGEHSVVVQLLHHFDETKQSNTVSCALRNDMEKFFRSWKLPCVKSEEDSLVLIGLRLGIVSIFDLLLFAY